MLYPACIVALAKSRGDMFRDDAVRQQVGDRAFKAVAHFDAHLAIVLGHQQQDAVVNVLAPQLPGAEQLIGIVLKVRAA